MRKKKNTHEIVIIQRTVKQKQKSVMKITNIYIYKRTSMKFSQTFQGKSKRQKLKEYGGN